ncbi:hypothetical protein ABE527_02530 [Brucella sp. TWI432]
MNEFGFRVERLTAGYKAFLRRACDAEAKPILDQGGKHRLFPSEADALRAIAHNLCRYVNGHLVREGEIGGSVTRNANALFPTLIKQRGKEKRIQVVRKGSK